MGLFGDNRALERIEDRLAGIEDAVSSLQRESRKLGLEYIELYDKVRHQMSRMAKRSARDTQELNEEPVVVEPDDGLDPISREILALRSGPRADT